MAHRCSDNRGPTVASFNVDLSWLSTEVQLSTSVVLWLSITQENVGSLKGGYLRQWIIDTEHH